MSVLTTLLATTFLTAAAADPIVDPAPNPEPVVATVDPLTAPAFPEPALVLVAGDLIHGFDEPRRGPELALNFGTFGVLDTEVVFETGLEYRFATRDVAGVLDLQPIVGLTLLADGGTYVYAGARHEWYFTDRFFLAPSFGAGIYQEGGVDLGGPLEFRSGLDLGARVTDSIEAAVGFYHLSNGGLYSLNGGAESALFSLAFGL